jgi:hypothetical protein
MALSAGYSWRAPVSASTDSDPLVVYTYTPGSGSRMGGGTVVGGTVVGGTVIGGTVVGGALVIAGAAVVELLVAVVVAAVDGPPVVFDARKSSTASSTVWMVVESAK